MHINRFEDDGFAIVADVLDETACASISASLGQAISEGTGARSMLEMPWCRALARTIRLHPLIGAALPEHAVAVQCTYFEKSRDQNWLVPIHQDLSIPVREKIDHQALSGWSEKDGAIFVQPPEAVLQELVAVRLHLDECGSDDGPLKVLPGSHKAGRLSAQAALTARDNLGEVSCTVGKGGVLILRPLLLHASSKANGSSRRRVLHFVFGPGVLPYGLRWQHAV
ncbi:phytanoyl-CoA dioxygenase [Duganella sp. Leaf61]|uniref:phytanoyl-CoA dioxygenase family protein n=1 Tax=Duganella sp. Leaf61 TaxID=1736227 RepID=UPI0006F62E79|nr:phytanoyl-CoA dioxygenase family protein [Duganella sp. Leaf61]KQN79147.1 phytanoyl-CoA dioxygenase [Duganella sp. Leaf61]